MRENITLTSGLTLPATLTMGVGIMSRLPTFQPQPLKAAVTFLGPTLGFLAGDVSAHSLRAAGAMALLCAHVLDTDIIRLVGRWLAQ
jgi:hypothetical protein